MVIPLDPQVPRSCSVCTQRTTPATLPYFFKMALRHFKPSLRRRFAVYFLWSSFVEVRRSVCCVSPFLKRLPIRPWQDRWVKQGARAQEQGPLACLWASPMPCGVCTGMAGLEFARSVGQGWPPLSTGFHLGLRERREVAAPHLGCRMVDWRTPGTTKGGGAKAQRLSSLRPCRPRPSSPLAHLSFQFTG